MTAKRVLLNTGIVATVIVAISLTAMLWPHQSTSANATDDVWTCSMHPQIRLPAPGNCPICGMALIPVSKLPKVKEDLETRSGLEVEAITRRELFKEIRTVGKLDYSERQVELITSRIAGRVDRLYADFTGFDVKKGDHLVEIYSPELYATQNDLLISIEGVSKEKQPSLGKDFSATRLEAARTKLRLLGITDEQMAEIEKVGKPRADLTIYAPRGGTVIEKSVRVGQYVAMGDPLYRIANLDPIWLYLNIYEFDIAWVRFGQRVDVSVEAFPGESFSGSVMFIDPFLDDATRTIRVRVNIKNADHLLKPQMFATATIRVRLGPDGSPEPTGLEGKYVCPMHPEVVQDDPGKCPICEMPLEKVSERPHIQHVGQHVPGHEHPQDSNGVVAIPVSAVLDTGRRRIAYRLTKDGAYELVELKIGARAQATDESGRSRQYFVVIDGLAEGDKVVTQSGFLLDSQRQIEGMPSLLYPSGQAQTSGHAGHGGHAVQPGDSSIPASMPSGHKH